MGKGEPFLEVLSSAIHEDFRFPFLEIFAFLYTLGTFAMANFTAGVYSQIGTNETVAFTVTSSLIGFSILIFLILVFKNIAYGLGSELEKGIIQTYFSYPLKRRAILTAKLLSGIGVSLLLFLGIQISAFYIMAPDIVLPQFGTIVLTYAANLSYPLFLSAILLLLTLKLQRGGIGLVVGFVLYIAMSIVSGLALLVATSTKSPLVLQIMSLISPSYALQYHYGGLANVPTLSLPWTPTLTEATLYVVGSYVIVAALFILGYVYFSRRLNL
jgi:ABC-type transport system involved in multi-copper enzyme maturation permease subunit